LHCLPLDVYSYKTCQISCPLPSIDCKFWAMCSELV
jgi:hypothetical protein